MPLATVVSSTESLLTRYGAYREANPKAHLRDAAAALGVSEAELLVASGGERVTALRLDDLPRLLADIGRLGELRTMTRNDHAVIEQTGYYRNLEFFGPAMGQTVGSIDLRIFTAHWVHAYGVMTGDPARPRCSVQFFDRHGVNVHKVFTNDSAAFRSLCSAWRLGGGLPILPVVEPAQHTVERPDAEVDTANLRARWDALTDTHEFHGMLRELQVSRTQALRLAGGGRARPVPALAFEIALEQAARQAETLMLFVGNRGLVQIFIGPIRRVVRTEGWLNVLDPSFNLHLRDRAIAQAWIVDKPTRHGPVRSLECYAANGETIIQMFGKRTASESTPAGFARILDLAMNR